MSTGVMQAETLGRVSVIIPVFNATASLGRCLESVYGQALQPAEVIIVNDGSTDNVDEFIKAYKSKIIYLSQVNQGPAASRNAGLKIATSEFIAFLDADDYWLPNFLNRCVSFLQTHPQAIAVNAGQRIKLWGHKEQIRPLLLEDQINPALIGPMVIEDFFSFWAKHNHITTGSVVIRKEIINKAGGQRTDFRICEDFEYWGYLATFGKWGFIPEALLVCDPIPVAKAQGWMKKHEKRCQQTPTVEEWEARIIPRLKQNDWPGFKVIRGRVAKSIVFMRILAGDSDMAISTALKYGNDFPNDYISKLILFGSRIGALGWEIICFLIRIRELTKASMINLFPYGK